MSSINLSNELKRVAPMLALLAVAGCGKPSLDTVRAKWPDRTIYELKEGRIAIGKPVGPIVVRWIDVTATSPERLMMDVNYKSAESKPIAPYVRVITYSASGDVLSETSVVSHTLADLQPGNTGNTFDFIPLPMNQKPVAFSLAPAPVQPIARPLPR